MQIQVNFSHVDGSDALDEHVRTELDSAIGRFADRITRIEAHLADENAHKSGSHDKRVRLEARPAGRDPIMVEAHGEDFYDTVADAAGKLRRALTSRLERD
jgi:ribosomal subunit interface protein